jgi:CRP-like cAMP-binding protein
MNGGRADMARTTAIDRRALLAGNALFEHVAEADLDALLATAKISRYKANQIIFQKDDPGTAMMAVLDGRVKISSFSMDGKEAVLNIIEPGMVFGEIALLDGKERTADATAMADCELLMLYREDFLPILEARPQFAIRLLEMVCGRLRDTSKLVEDAFTLTTPTRLARQLLRLAKNYGRETDDGVMIDFKMSQRELAAYVGLARENINRQLRAWEKEELISVESGAVTIIDMETMRDIAELDEEF